jgi:hypothetical protein
MRAPVSSDPKTHHISINFFAFSTNLREEHLFRKHTVIRIRWREGRVPVVLKAIELLKEEGLDAPLIVSIVGPFMPCALQQQPFLLSSALIFCKSDIIC